MSFAGRLLRQFRAWSSPAKAAGRAVKLRAVNLARNVDIATRIEVADTSAKRSKGLLGRSGLGPGEGLWIVPCESVHTFGMRFPIDLVYLDRTHRIRKIRKNVPPWRISACFTAHSVLELPADSIGEDGAQPGDMVAFISVDSEDSAKTDFESGSERAGSPTRSNPATNQGPLL